MHLLYIAELLCTLTPTTTILCDTPQCITVEYKVYLSLIPIVIITQLIQDRLL